MCDSEKFSQFFLFFTKKYYLVKFLHTLDLTENKFSFN